VVYFGYNGLGERTHKWRTTLNTTTETQYTLDVAGGLPHVIVETSEGQTSRYLTGLAQQQDNFWAYQHADGLGSVRHLSDASADVTRLQNYDPFGNLIAQSGPGSSGFGYTGEQEDANYGLVFLRARYYEPSTGRFVSKDPWPGDTWLPQTLNGYSYVENNTINRRDPHGLQGEPTIPTPQEWKKHSGWEENEGYYESYYPVALQRIIDYRFHIIAAARRHSFVTGSVCKATEPQLDLLYTLAAIIYRESYGYDEEVASAEGFASEILAGSNIRNPLVKDEAGDVEFKPTEGEVPSIGIAQMRPETAFQVEQVGLVYVPGSKDGKWIYLNPTPFNPLEDQGLPFINLPFVGFANYEPAARLSRLVDPVWAIEYVAANMEFARQQKNYNNSKHHELGRQLTEWERMAAWYNQGVFDTQQRPIVIEYLNGTYKDKQGIRGTDLLGIETHCDNNCDGRTFP
jgi:RHS repeat-associated protein